MLFTSDEKYKNLNKYPGKTFWRKMELKKLLKEDDWEISYYTDFLLNELDDSTFYLYDGTDTRTPCGKMQWLVFWQPQYIEKKEIDWYQDLMEEYAVAWAT